MIADDCDTIAWMNGRAGYHRVFTVVVVLVVVSGVQVAVSGCAPPESRRVMASSAPTDEHRAVERDARAVLAELEREQQRQTERLQRIQAQIVDSEHRAEYARQQAAYQQCRASAAAIDADISLRKATCANRVAEHYQCLATEERGVTDKAVGGCVLGLFAGWLSGGALAPWALGGCGVGYATGESGRDHCPVPTCLQDAPHWPMTEARRRNHTGLPVCRGRVELVQSVRQLPSALRVTGVIHGTAATQAGVRVGDIVIAVNGEATATGAQLAQAIARAPSHTPSAIEYLRGSIVHIGWGTIGTAPGYARRIVGVRYRQHHGVRYPVISVGATMDGSRLRVGDRVLSVAGAIPSDVSAAAAAFSAQETASETTVEIRVLRGGETIDITVGLQP